MTINDLKNLGASVEEGVMRCAGNESFYLMLVPKALDVSRYDALEKLWRRRISRRPSRRRMP